MSDNRHIVFWIAVLASLVAAISLLRDVLLPFVTGMVLAYLLDPLANRLVRLGMNRGLATLAIIAVVVLLITGAVFFTAPVIGRELSFFVKTFPLYVERLHTMATDPDHPWLSKVVGEGLNEAKLSLGELTTLASGWFSTFLRSAWSGGRALLSVLSLGVVVPIVACYLLYDWERMIGVIDNWVPPAHRDAVRALAHEVDKTVSGFVRGQTALCLILALYYASTLWLIDLRHGPLIGFAAGLMSFVPYVGFFVGIIVASCVAIAQFWPDMRWILLVPTIFLVGQSIGDYVLEPYVVGRRVHLNPVWVMFALFAFGYLFGFVGLVIAVPVAAAIGVLMRFAFRQYYASTVYSQAPAP